MLEANLGLPRTGQVEVLLRLVEADQTADAIHAGGLLGIDRHVRGQFVYQPDFPAVRRQAAVTARSVAIGRVVIAIHVHDVAAHAGHQRQSITQLRTVFRKQRDLLSGAGELLTIRRCTFKFAPIGVVPIDRLTTGVNVVVRRVAVQIEVDAIVVSPHQRSAIKAKQIMVESKRLTVANLFLLVFDAEITTAQQGLPVFIPRMVFGVLPTALSFEVIQLVAGAEVIADLPLAVQACPLVVVVQLGVPHVVVLVAQALVVMAIDQRHTEVVLWRLGAIVVAQGKRQIIVGLPAQGGADKGVFRVAVVDPAIALRVVDIQPVAQGVGQ